MENNFTYTELANEVWRDVDGYDGMYQVSDLGRVRSLKFGKVRVLRPNKNKDGYLQVALCKDGKQKSFYVHRLVANAFISNDDKYKTQINHRDECKQNNKVSNLEYCTHKYNSTYNDLHYRRRHPNYRRNAIKDIYNPDLTINENLKMFKEQGIECCEKTVRNLRKELGLTRQRNILHKLKDLYDPNLTYKQNISIFNENGVECSISTFYRLRKDITK